MAPLLSLASGVVLRPEVVGVIEPETLGTEHVLVSQHAEEELIPSRLP